MTATKKPQNEIAVIEPAATSFLAVIKDAAKDPTCDTGKMEVLYNLHKNLLADEAKRLFTEKYMAAKLEMPRIRKDGKVEYLENKNDKAGPKVEAFRFATYENIDKQIRPIEEKYGFSRIFTTKPRVGDGGGTVVHCTLLHSGGHSIEAEISLALDMSGGKNNIQAMGSSFSYGKRYTTEMLWDIVKEGADDDANSVDLIDEKQFKKLKKLIEETGTVEADFLAYYAVEALDQLQRKLFSTVENILLTKKNMQLTEKLKGAK